MTKKTLVVRGSYSMPENDFALIDALRKAAAMTGTITTISEVNCCPRGVELFGHNADKKLKAPRGLLRLDRPRMR